MTNLQAPALKAVPDPVIVPANMRRRIVFFGASIAFLSFLDRAAISQAAPAIMRDLHLSSVQMGIVFSAFGITYALGEIPAGWLCDRFGARLMLTRVIVLWSFFTAATGLAWNFPSLVASRLLFGAGESGCFPSLARVFSVWLTPKERNSAEGIKAASARWGAAITPALMAALFTFLNWRMIFAVFGAVGLVSATAFWITFRDRPVSRSSEYASISWLKLARSRSAWLLGLQWFCHYYGFYFYITWLPVYLLKARGLDLRHEAAAASLPLLMAGLGSLIAGFILPSVIRKLNSAVRARRIFGYAAYGGAALLLAAFTQINNPFAAIVILSLSSFAAEFSSPITWTTAMDIGGEHVGSVSGLMNMLGHLGGTIAPTVTGLLLTYTGNAWNAAFYASALIYAAGALCWRFIDPVQALDLGLARNSVAERPSLEY